MSALSPPLVWLLRDHADERELVMSMGDDEVRAAYDDRGGYDQEADRLLEKHAQALALELVSPRNDPSRAVSMEDALQDLPKLFISSIGFSPQERWAQHREQCVTSRRDNPCSAYLLNPAPMQKSGVRAAQLSQVCRVLHGLFAERSAIAHRAHLRRKDACIAASQTIAGAARQNWCMDWCNTIPVDNAGGILPHHEIDVARTLMPREPMTLACGARSSLCASVHGKVQFVGPFESDVPRNLGVDVLQLHLSNIRASTTSRMERVCMHKEVRPRKTEWGTVEGHFVSVSERMNVETTHVAFDVEVAGDDVKTWLPSVWPGAHPPNLLRGCAPETDRTKNFRGHTLGQAALLSNPMDGRLDTSLIRGLGLPWADEAWVLESSTFRLDYNPHLSAFRGFHGLVVDHDLPVGWDREDVGQQKPSKLLRLPTSIFVELVFRLRGGVRLKLNGTITDSPRTNPGFGCRNLQRRLLVDIPSGAIDARHLESEHGAQRVIDYARLPAEEKRTRLLKGVTVVWQDYGFDVPTPRPLGPAAAAEEDI